MSKKTIGLAIFMSLYVLGAYYFGSKNLPKLWSLTNKSNTTIATVVSITPSNHDTYTYTYRDKMEKSYQNRGTIHDQNLHLGQKVKISYFPDKPEWSYDEEVRPKLVTEIVFVIIVPAVISGFLSYGILKSIKDIRR